MSPKSARKWEKWEGVSAPKPYGREVWLGPHLCPSENHVKRPEKRKKKPGPPAAPRHQQEEEGAAASTRLLVMLQHHRKLGDGPTYKTHRGNGERTLGRGERGWRTEGKGLTGDGGVLTVIEGKGKPSGI